MHFKLNVPESLNPLQMLASLMAASRGNGRLFFVDLDIRDRAFRQHRITNLTYESGSDPYMLLFESKVGLGKYHGFLNLRSGQGWIAYDPVAINVTFVRQPETALVIVGGPSTDQLMANFVQSDLHERGLELDLGDRKVRWQLRQIEYINPTQYRLKLATIGQVTIFHEVIYDPITCTGWLER